MVGSPGSYPVNVSDRRKGEEKRMKEEDLHRAKCPANIPDRSGGECGGGGECKGRTERRGGRKLQEVKRPPICPTRRRD